MLGCMNVAVMSGGWTITVIGKVKGTFSATAPLREPT